MQRDADHREVSSLLAVTDRDHVDGPAEAPAVLLIYGDYECPHTRAAHLVVRRVQPRLTGTLQYVYRHFPLRTTHPHAQHAAEMAEEAHRAGAFWAMHDHLFHHQQALDDADLVRYAIGHGVEERDARDALARHPHAARVEDDVQSGIANGVHGTPTLFINGVRYQGERSVGVLEAALRRVTEREAP